MIYLSPRGRLLDRDLAEELSREPALVLLSGHYEGVDQRVLDAFDFEEISIGDYILTGGELPSMVLIDTVCRLVPGVLGSEESHIEESIYSGLLEYPQYTRPASFDGMDVPDVLISGDHAKIAFWNFEQSLKLTAERRPDLLRKWMTLNYDKLDKKQKKIASLFYETIHVAGAVIVKDMKVLATQRGYGNYTGWWEFPGGKIKEGEDPRAALKRELEEELIADINVSDFFCETEYSYPEFHVILRCYLCELTSGDISLLEHSNAAWLGLDDIHSVKWLGADLPVIEKLISEKIID
jgi:mutator protein MutT